MGFEPTTHGTTIRYSNQLSYIYHQVEAAKVRKFLKKVTVLKKNNKKYENLSPSRIAWQKFRKNKTGVISLCFIILCALIAVFAYIIVPDTTPYANMQILEISTQKPGFECDFLQVKKNTTVEKPSFINRLWSGRPSLYRNIPFDSLEISKEKTTVFIFNPEHAGEPFTEEFSNEIFSNGLIFNSDEEAETYISANCVTHRKFILGTDQFGRDFFSRLILGTRISFSVGFIAVILSVLIGLLIGGLAGFFRGWVDDVLMWFVNVVWSLPTLLVVIAITFALGKGIVQVFIAVGLTMWVEVARITRGQIMSIRETTYVEAGRALGFGNARIIIRHIIPNVINPIIVVSAANFASAILLEAGLSFLGIGVQPPMPSWGGMIKENYAYIILDNAYLAILPGLAIMLLVLAFMLTGNALRDALDVKK